MEHVYFLIAAVKWTPLWVWAMLVLPILAAALVVAVFFWDRHDYWMRIENLSLCNFRGPINETDKK